GNANGANGFPMNQYDERLEWGRANFDIRHQGFVGGTIGLPLKLTVNPFITMRSGSPFNITTGQTIAGDGIVNARPSLVSCSTPPSRTIRITRYGCFNLDPAAGASVIPVNYGEGPGQFSVNLRISRTWGWGERAVAAPTAGDGGPPDGGGRGPGGGAGGFGGRGGPGGGPGGGRGGFGGFGGGNTGKRYNVTLTASARNAFNHVNDANPSGILSSPLFGVSTALASGGGNSAAGNRKVEIQLRFQF
ncbi:MAG: hypothetical protein M3N93_02470, partial [Acidobacteriota bacterium]|nr:hypothetical protein [Acidobacteriota bacterium]